MEVIEETKKDGRLVLNYTHRILPGVTQVENYGKVEPPSDVYTTSAVCA